MVNHSTKEYNPTELSELYYEYQLNLKRIFSALYEGGGLRQLYDQYDDNDLLTRIDQIDSRIGSIFYEQEYDIQRPYRVLNLWAGIGGNRRRWDEFDNISVTAVELNDDVADVYETYYPQDLVIRQDALHYLVNNYEMYDFIWASVPCKTNSKNYIATRHKVNKLPKSTIWQVILFLRARAERADVKWVVENVKPWWKKEMNPLIHPDYILGRHSFWSNFLIPNREFDKEFSLMKAKKDQLEEWLGIRIEHNIYLNSNDPLEVYRNAVHPDIGHYVMKQVIDPVDNLEAWF